ncbi:MAG TPA: magnesium-translocating P-type ATPase, partial [Anaerolineae bacterium]
VLRYYQESRADLAAEKLQAMVSTTATAIREGKRREIPLQELVPGDIVALSAGDMIPADVRIISAKDLFLNQAALTGESLPAEKSSAAVGESIQNPLEMSDLCFMGSNVESGTGVAVVVHTGGATYFGALASSITGVRQLTSFDKGITSFTWLMIGFMLVMVPLVFLFNGISKGNWLEAFLFALAVAVGLTPEMLPMIVTVNLSKGALAMSRKKVIVKRLNAIQNFGAMDTLCTDKTGTITEGKIVLEKHLDVRGRQSEPVLNYGYINSYYQTGLKNLLDVAILNHRNLNDELQVDEKYRKIDELPFDFQRRRMSVIVEDDQNRHLLICKGAVEEVMRLSTHVEIDGEVLDVLPEHDEHRKRRIGELNAEGFRVIAVAYRWFNGDNDEPHYSIRDESDLTLLGYLAFLDPPKVTAPEALRKLSEHSVAVKILTGDNDAVTRRICEQVGLPVEHLVSGDEIEAMTEAQLADAAESISVFAKLSPSHKERIIRALQSRGHVVGFMGDGINDAPALKTADVGISVDTAVDIAKESSDIILLENSLLVLEQ